MSTNHQISKKDIEELNYPDFVAFINQKNTPPGGEITTTAWTENGCINKDSHILDLACTTGFSSRTISLSTGCSADGIDISSKAIKGAQQEAETNKLNRLSYQVADACNLPFKENTFTHVLGGCNFSFIQDREAALGECARTLRTKGILCISSFYYTKEPPEELLEEVYQAIGFKPNPEWTAAYWDKLFSKQFHKMWEEHYELPTYDKTMVEKLIKQQIYTPELREKIKDSDILDACYAKLLRIRSTLNKHRDYQGFCIQTWTKK